MVAFERRSPMGRKRVLWLDEGGQFEAFVHWFDDRYDFVHVLRGENCLTKLHKGGFDLVISEYELVCSDFPLDETDQGFSVGAFLYREIRKFNSAIPVVFYHLALGVRAKRIEEQFDHPDQKVWAFSKIEVEGDEFSREVIKILG
ncbi:MAG: hypothetical protein EXS55_01840 [Candidatus Magasanikbacteria bacterium]|nr:hypothetical protein [Candidatus Magasanikbacteria bacterium]